MPFRQTRTPFVPLALVLILCAGTAHADPTAAAFLKARHGEVEKILRRKGGGPAQAQARQQKLALALSQLLDLQELSRRALKDHWAGLDGAQQKEFVALLTQLVETSYQKNLESTLDFSVTYGRVQPAAENGVLVPTVAKSRKNRRSPPVHVDYSLRKQGEVWRVYDITTDGVSLVSNYRSQFNRIIKKEGWDALLAKMRKRLGSGDDPV